MEYLRMRIVIFNEWLSEIQVARKSFPVQVDEHQWMSTLKEWNVYFSDVCLTKCLFVSKRASVKKRRYCMGICACTLVEVEGIVYYCFSFTLHRRHTFITLFQSFTFQNGAERMFVWKLHILYIFSWGTLTLAHETYAAQRMPHHRSRSLLYNAYFVLTSLILRSTTNKYTKVEPVKMQPG